MSEPQPISSYGMIGDMRTAALVGLDGAVDWCCLPRFDEDPLFCRLIDAQRGGFLATQPVAAHSSSREYVEGTNFCARSFGRLRAVWRSSTSCR